MSHVVTRHIWTQLRSQQRGISCVPAYCVKGNNALDLAKVVANGYAGSQPSACIEKYVRNSHKE